MLKMITWLDKHFTSFRPTREIVRRATRHLKSADRKNLFSPEIPEMRTAEGRWYEAIVYEMLLEISRRSDSIGAVVRRGADAPFRSGHAKPGQNGVIYAKNGDIKIRGNGQDLAELDFLIVDHDGRLAFGEVVTSPSDMKDFEQEILYKKRLIGYLYGQPNVPFLLVSSVDISRNHVMRRILKEPDNALIVTQSCEDLKSFITPADLRQSRRKPQIYPNMIGLSDLPIKRSFDYKKLHDERRSLVMKAVTSGTKIGELGKGDAVPQIVKKIFLGALHPGAIGWLSEHYPMHVRGDVYDRARLTKGFSKVVLAVDLPEYELIIYLRSRRKREYFKMVPDGKGGFRFQGLRNPHMKGFFIWMESVKPCLDVRETKEILSYFVSGATAGKKGLLAGASKGASPKKSF